MHLIRSTAGGAIAGLSLVLCAPVGVQAQEPILLDDILVSGGRQPVPVNAIGRAYTVITAEQLENRGTRYVADALRGVPGISVTRTGSFGGTTAIFMRGADSNQVLVLIDGVEVSSIGDGQFDFGGLLATDIARIEVLRGPQSALYGSNASAGVISIITKRGTRNAANYGFTAEGGSDGTAFGSGYFRGGGQTWDGALSVAVRRTDGFDISTAGNGEKDGDRNVTANAKFNWDLTEDFALGATARFVDREAEFDGFSGGRVVDADGVTEQRDVFTSIFATHEAFDDALVSTLRFEYTDVVVSSLTDGQETFRTNGARYHVIGQSSYGFDLDLLDSNHVLTGALDYEREVNIAQTRDFFLSPPPVIETIEQTRETVGVVGEYRGSYFGFVDLQAGVRQDFNDAFEDALTYSVAASVRNTGTGTRLHASVGKGVTNPTFIEQFGFFPDQFIGNPDLKPELTFGWDVGVEQSFLDGRLIVDATYFRAKVTDQIVNGFDPVAQLPNTVNASGESPRQGVELALSAQPVAGLTFGASYTYTLAQTPDGIRENRRPKHSGRVTGTYSFLDDRASVTVGVGYQGDRRDLNFATFPGRPVTLDNYFLVDVSAEYAVTDQVGLFARVENATNAEYEEVFNYSTQGVAGFAGLRLTF